MGGRTRGQGEVGSVVVTKRVKGELWKGNSGGGHSLMGGSGKFYLTPPLNINPSKIPHPSSQAMDNDWS